MFYLQIYVGQLKCIQRLNILMFGLFMILLTWIEEEEEEEEQI
ncbi:MAG: hypothetical protein ACJA2N_001809 [Salibacteraceae bacterium]|jgi:hypothetical protein